METKRIKRFVITMMAAAMLLPLQVLADGNVKKGVIINNIDPPTEKAATPTASIATGTEVEKGTTVTLSCTTEDAIIYYTTDGTIPTEDNTARLTYSEPIAINADVTLNVMTSAPLFADSEIATFSYTVKASSTLAGDVNGDGEVNGTDIVALVNRIMNGTEYNGNPDVNGDGSVNGTDIVALVNIIMGNN